MKNVNKAFLGAILLAGTALVASSPAKAQVVQFEGYGGTDPNYGADPYAQGYQDPAYGYQDPGYDPNYAQGYQDPAYGYQDPAYGQDPAYDPYYDQQYAGDYSGDYYYDYSDPNYYYAPTYTPVYDPFYNPYCDYYTPPWGYPLDYCRYQTWNQPVYFGGLWYSGPIYYRQIGGVPWYWLNGGWRRDQWRGSRPSYIDWGRNHRWNGDRNNWRDEYRRGNWAGRDTWVGRNYRDNIREARTNVLDRASDRNFRRDFAARNNLRRGGDVAGVRGRGGDFNRQGLATDGRGRNNNGFDRRALRDGGSNLVRPNDRGSAIRGGGPRVDRQLDNRALRNEQPAPRNFAAPDRGQRFDNRAQQRSFAAPQRTPRVENRGGGGGGQRFDNRAQQRSFAAPQRAPRVESRAFGGGGQRFDNRAQQRSFAAPQRAPRVQERGLGGGGNRNAFSAPSAPRVARPSGGQRFEARGGGGGGARAFSGGGGGSPRVSSGGGGGGGNRSFTNSRSGGGGAATRGGGGGNRGGRGRDR